MPDHRDSVPVPSDTFTRRPSADAPPRVSQGAVRAAMEGLHIVGHSPSDDSLDLSAHVYLDDVLDVADRLDAEGE